MCWLGRSLLNPMWRMDDCNHGYSPKRVLGFCYRTDAEHLPLSNPCQLSCDPTLPPNENGPYNFRYPFDIWNSFLSVDWLSASYPPIPLKNPTCKLFRITCLFKDSKRNISLILIAVGERYDGRVRYSRYSPKIDNVFWTWLWMKKRNNRLKNATWYFLFRYIDEVNFPDVLCLNWTSDLICTFLHHGFYSHILNSGARTYSPVLEHRPCLWKYQQLLEPTAVWGEEIPPPDPCPLEDCVPPFKSWSTSDFKW